MAGQVSQRTIELAHEYLGKVESRIRPNWADWLDKLMIASGNPSAWKPGEPYCIAALCSLFKIAAGELKIRFPLRYYKGTQLFYEQALKDGMTSQTPNIGDVVIFRVGTTARGHAGLVVSKNETGIGTIEFNTANNVAGSQRDGEGVYMKFRRFADFTKTDKPKLWIRGYVTTSKI